MLRDADACDPAYAERDAANGSVTRGTPGVSMSDSATGVAEASTAEKQPQSEYDKLMHDGDTLKI